jgi:hypothetical protein
MEFADFRGRPCEITGEVRVEAVSKNICVVHWADTAARLPISEDDFRSMYRSSPVEPTPPPPDHISDPPLQQEFEWSPHTDT